MITPKKRIKWGLYQGSNIATTNVLQDQFSDDVGMNSLNSQKILNVCNWDLIVYISH